MNFNENSLKKHKKTQRSSSNSCLLKQNNDLKESELLIKTENFGSSSEKKNKKTFLESTFNTKMAKKLTLEKKKNLNITKQQTNFQKVCLFFLHIVYFLKKMPVDSVVIKCILNPESAC